MLDARLVKRLVSGGMRSLTVDVEFSLGDGITVLFGPSGAGKTTVLRLVAGVASPDEGRVTFNGRVWFDSADGTCVPVRERRVGFVFQDALLFPHLTAAENVAFGIREKSGTARRSRAAALLELVGASHAGNRRPPELSGGEQQRVALARALAVDPGIVLLDEPLSAVDVASRARLLDEIGSLQRKTSVPFLYVTHNPGEAVRLGDAILLLDDGRILQQGSPLEVFSAPQSVPAARAVGTENIFAATVLAHRPEDGITRLGIGPCTIDAAHNSLAPGSRVTVGIRSEDILLARERLSVTSARNVLEGSVRSIVSGVDTTELIADCGVPFRVSITAAAVRDLSLAPGSPVFLLFKARAVHLLT